MKITKIKLADLKKPERNVRKHTDKQMVEYVRSLDMFGQIRPLVVDENYVIIAGNGLYDALLKKGADTADCYVVTGLTDKEKKKLMLADNKIFELGYDDTDAFDAILKELEGDVDIPGWDEDLLKMLNATAEEAIAEAENYGVFPQEDVQNIQKGQDKKTKTAESGSYEPVPAPKQEDTPTDGLVTPAAPADPEQEEQETRRYVICPKCGEKVFLS